MEQVDASRPTDADNFTRIPCEKLEDTFIEAMVGNDMIYEKCNLLNTPRFK